MKKKFCIILAILLLIQIIGTNSALAASTKTVTHTITDTKFRIEKTQGPDSYHYDDGNYFGTLNKVKTTWEIKRLMDENIWTSYFTNDKRELQAQYPPEDYLYREIRYAGYRNVDIYEVLWVGGIYEGDFKGFDGNSYKYMRSCGARFECDTYRYTSYYEGVVTARNTNPELMITEPIKNYKIGNQDSVMVSGEVKDVDIGNILNVKYSLETIKNQNIILTQPTKLISNSQWQMFRGYIQLQGLKTGTSLLELWAEDNQGGKSKTVEIPIIIFSTLENILDALKKYTVKTGNPQFMIINSDSRIVQNIENDRLIEQIKKELQSKNIKLFFSGKDGETEAYISSKLLN